MGGNKENRTVFIVMCIAIFLLMLASPFISLPCNSNRTKAVIPVVQSNQVDNIKPPTDEEIKEIIKSEPPRLNQEYNIEGARGAPTVSEPVGEVGDDALQNL